MVQSGDKGTLIARLKLHDTCVSKGLLTPDGMEPWKLKLPELRTVSANLKLSPIGNQDELLRAVVEHLEQNPSSSSKQTSKPKAAEKGKDEDENEDEDAPDASGPAEINSVEVAKRVLALDEEMDYEGILNLGSTPQARITSSSSTATMRKAYLKLSLVIHPDKLSRVYENATKAFQALVKAFERLSSPSIPAEESKAQAKNNKGGKAQTLFRSNEGCYRTRVLCPRCRQPWNEGTLDGNPPYFYNFLMMGLKQNTCSTCLCQFGCMTAIHLCPHCKHPIDYFPDDYHRKVTCGNSRCKKPFGFMMFTCSDRALQEMQKEVKADLEARIKARDAKQRRAGRMKQRGVDQALTDREEERAFLLGLVDGCPRCGLEFEGEPDEAEQRRHLMECTDTKAHKKHAQRKREKAAVSAAKEEKEELQESLQGAAAWRFLGANTDQLWLLDEKQLRIEAERHGADPRGNKGDLIKNIVSVKQITSSIPIPIPIAVGDGDDDSEDAPIKRKSITVVDLVDNGGDSDRIGGGDDDSEEEPILAKKKKKSTSTSTSTALIVTTKTTDKNKNKNIVSEQSNNNNNKRRRKQQQSTRTLPSNLHSMSVDDVRAVCAAWGLPVGDEGRMELIDMLEDHALGDSEK